jgi:hypothetical protein
MTAKRFQTHRRVSIPELRTRGDVVGVPFTLDEWFYDAGPIAALFRRSFVGRLIQTDILKRRTDEQ